MFSVSNRHQIVLGLTLLLTLLLGGLIIYCPPALYPDPGWGFQVMRSMQMGGGFNLAVTPDAGNIAKNTSAFLTWWSPGQYLLPYGFKKLLSLNYGQASAATIIFCDLSGILGFYCFFKKLGFTQIVSALSVAFIACQQFFFVPYVFYNGGETLLFGFLGWFLYGCFNLRKTSWQMFVFVLLSGWIGFFCKSAFLWMYASGLLCLWINISRPNKDILAWIKNGIWLAVPAVVSLAVIYKAFLSKGSNPASSSSGLSFSLEAFGFPLASPLLSGFSIDDLFHGLIYHADKAIINPFQTAVVLTLLAVTSLGLFVAIIQFIPNPKYKTVVCAFYGVSCLFFFSVFLRKLDISYESRHFRIVGLLFIPGIGYFSSRFKLPFKALFILLWAYIGITSLKYFYANYKYNVKVSARGTSGISQLFIDQQSLNYIKLLDNQHHNDALFVFTSVDLGLEIQHNRIITLDAVEPGNKNTYVNDNEHGGHAGALYIMIPAYYATNGSLSLIEQSFPDYKNFNIKQLSKNYVLVSGL